MLKNVPVVVRARKYIHVKYSTSQTQNLKLPVPTIARVVKAAWWNAPKRQLRWRKNSKSPVSWNDFRAV